MAEFAARTLNGQGFSVMFPADGNVPAGTVALASLPDGRIDVYGLVATRRERLTIAESPVFSSGKAVFRLDSAEEEIASANAELRKAYPETELVLEERGVGARLAGLVNRPEDGAAAYRLARSRLDSRIPIRRSLLVWTELRWRAEREAVRLGLDGARFELKGGEVVLTSENRPDQRQREELLEALRTSFGEPAALLFARALGGEPPAPDKQAALPPPLPELDVTAAPSWSKTIVPGVERLPESDPVPAPKLEPDAKEWLVAEIFAGGFIDQSGTRHGVGTRLSDNLRVEGVWDRGVILKRGLETILVENGSKITENKIYK